MIGGEGGSGLFLLLLFFMSWGYRVVFEKTRGATPGKKRGRLKVVMTSGAPLRWTAAILRNLLRVADFLPAAYFTGLGSCLMSRRFQRLGDLVADTIVVLPGPAERPAPIDAVVRMDQSPPRMILEVQASRDLGLTDPWHTIASRSAAAAWSGAATFTTTPPASGRSTVTVTPLRSAPSLPRQSFRVRWSKL